MHNGGTTLQAMSSPVRENQEGINRSDVEGAELEPIVQVGTACDISGFPCGHAQQHHD